MNRLARGPKWKPAAHSRVCSNHFQNGKRSCQHPHPTVFPLRQESRFLQPGASDRSLRCARHDDVRACATAEAAASAGVVEPSERDKDGSDSDVEDAYEPDVAEPLGRNLAADPMDYDPMDYDPMDYGETRSQRSEPQFDLGLLSDTSDSDSNTSDEPESERESEVSEEHGNVAASVNLADLPWYYGLDEEDLMEEMPRMEQEIEELRHMVFSLENIAKSDKDMRFYTGLPDFETFNILYEKLFQPVEGKIRYSDTNNKFGRSRRRHRLSPKEECFLVLTILRRGIQQEDLARRVGLHQTTISRIFRAWLTVLDDRLSQLPIWPTRKLLLMKKCLPPSRNSIRQLEPILDCTELYIETPSSFRAQGGTYSSYKHHNTAKGLIAMSPSGAVIFTSKLYGGRASDKAILKDCGILERLETGDSIMADRGFGVGDELPAGITMNTLSFMEGRDQLPPEEEAESRRIASLRIHVERVIGRVKGFRILQQVIPLRLKPFVGKIWRVCCHLANFLPPLIAGKVQEPSGGASSQNDCTGANTSHAETPSGGIEQAAVGHVQAEDKNVDLSSNIHQPHLTDMSDGDKSHMGNSHMSGEYSVSESSSVLVSDSAFSATVPEPREPQSNVERPEPDPSIQVQENIENDGPLGPTRLGLYEQLAAPWGSGLPRDPVTGLLPDSFLQMVNTCTIDNMLTIFAALFLRYPGLKHVFRLSPQPICSALVQVHELGPQLRIIPTMVHVIRHKLGFTRSS